MNVFATLRQRRFDHLWQRGIKLMSPADRHHAQHCGGREFKAVGEFASDGMTFHVHGGVCEACDYERFDSVIYPGESFGIEFPVGKVKTEEA